MRSVAKKCCTHLSIMMLSLHSHSLRTATLPAAAVILRAACRRGHTRQRPDRKKECRHNRSIPDFAAAASERVSNPRFPSFPPSLSLSLLLLLAPARGLHILADKLEACLLPDWLYRWRAAHSERELHNNLTQILDETRFGIHLFQVGSTTRHVFIYE